jgi:hypothetical protein
MVANENHYRVIRAALGCIVAMAGAAMIYVGSAGIGWVVIALGLGGALWSLFFMKMPGLGGE